MVGRVGQDDGLWRVGEVIAELYEVREVIRSGGMGVVYRVWHRGWNAELAIKSPRPAMLKSPVQLRNFETEAETWVNLGMHPNVVSCAYVRRLDAVPRVFAEWVDGGSLAEAISGGGLYQGDPVAVSARLLDAAIQFAWGLGYAHAQRLVHQDVKPANVMLGQDGSVKVTDFGLARARAATAEASSPRPGDSVLAGYAGMTPAYCSPEQAAAAAGDPNVVLRPSTDVWSWAISVWEMYLGERACNYGQLADQIFESFLNDPAAQGIVPMPAALIAILRDCLRARPGDRPTSMYRVADAIVALYPQEVGLPYPRLRPDATRQLADGLSNHALSMLDLGQPERAEQLWEQALTVDPHHLTANYNQSLHRWRRGVTGDDAVLARLRAIDSGLESAQRWRGRLLLARIHLERCDPASALDLLYDIDDEVHDDLDVRETIAAASEPEAFSLGVVELRCFRDHRATSGMPEVRVDLSGDGRTVLSGDADGAVFVWDVNSGRRLHRLRGHSSRVSVALGRDGRLALTGDVSGRLLLWEVSSGELLRELGSAGRVEACCLSADGRTAVAGGAAGRLTWWDTATGELGGMLDAVGAYRRAAIESLAISADGSIVLSFDGRYSLWHLPTGRRLREFEGISSPLALSPDGRFALTGHDSSTSRFGAVAYRALDREVPSWVSEVDIRLTQSAALAASAGIGVTGALDGLLRWFDLTTGRCLRTESVDTAMVPSVAISADGRVVVTGGGDRQVRVWRSPTLGAYQAPFQLCRPRSHSELTAIGRRAAELTAAARSQLAAGRDGDATALLRQARELPGHERAEEVLDLWNQLSMPQQRSGLRGAWAKGVIELPRSSISRIVLSADGRRVLSASTAGMSLWDFDDESCVRTFVSEPVVTAALSPDGRLALSAGQDGAIQLWDIGTGRPLQRYGERMRDTESVCFSPDQRLVFAGGSDGVLRCWAIESGQLIATYPPHPGRLTSISISPDGRYLVSTGTGTWIRVWDLVSASLAGTFTGPDRSSDWTSNAANDARISRDGRTLLSGNAYGVAHVWDVATGEILATADEHARNDGFAHPIAAVRWFADSRFAVAGSWDAAVRVLDTRTGRWLITLTGHTGWVKTVSTSRDGRYAASAGSDGTVRRWELDWELEVPVPQEGR